MGPPEPAPTPVDARDAARVDDAILKLWGSEHYIVIKRHYHMDIRQQREDLDYALRCLAHILGT